MAQFPEQTIDIIWEKAEIVPNNDPSIWRKDFAGAWIKRDQYGKEGEYGWEIDHLKPVSMGGTDTISNLLPMNWQNNRKKTNNYPNFLSAVSSEGIHNVAKIRSWKIG